MMQILTKTKNSDDNTVDKGFNIKAKLITNFKKNNN